MLRIGSHLEHPLASTICTLASWHRGVRHGLVPRSGWQLSHFPRSDRWRWIFGSKDKCPITVISMLPPIGFFQQHTIPVIQRLFIFILLSRQCSLAKMGFLCCLQLHPRHHLLPPKYHIIVGELFIRWYFYFSLARSPLDDH